jgi:hypothetical protein
MPELASSFLDLSAAAWSMAKYRQPKRFIAPAYKAEIFAAEVA